MLPNQRFARSTALFISLITLSFLLMTFDVRTEGGGVTGTLRDGVRTLFDPVQSAVSAVIRPVANATDALVNLAGLRAENDRLREELQEANRVLRETEGIRSENEVLRELSQLDLPGELLTQSLVARVQAGGSSNFDFSVVLNKGADDGIAIGQPVVNLEGLVGHVDAVTSNSATIRLLTNPDHAVAVRLVTSQFVGTAEGRGSGDLKLVSSRADGPIEEGEVVITFPNRYPAGLVVGTVARSAAPAAGVGIQTTVTPAVDFERLDFVRVIFFIPGSDEGPAEEVPAGEDAP
ncbi:MAG: rod shape-determining protein MreC [Acidimicrobiia bacterium]|nr:rod shape-determining protein MreC [Acidimicrobiia bacterium]